MIIEAEHDMEVVAEAGDADTARRRVSGLKPRALVLDLNMPGPPSLEQIPAILEGSPDTVIVVLTMQDDPAFAREAFRRGAKGFVIKHAAGRELVQAISETRRPDRRSSIPGSVPSWPPSPLGRPGGLTPREAEILGLIAAGHTNPEIADQLVISVRTVETHRAAVQRKLDTVNRAELVAFAKKHGLIDD